MENKDSLLSGCVGEILPPPEIYLSPMDYTHLVREVTRYAGVAPRSPPQFYEGADLPNRVLREPSSRNHVHILFDAVFDNVWGDYMLSEQDFADEDIYDPSSPQSGPSSPR